MWKPLDPKYQNNQSGTKVNVGDITMSYFKLSYKSTLRRQHCGSTEADMYTLGKEVRLKTR